MKYNTEIRSLIDELNYYTKCYDAGTPEISDAEWDNKYFHLASLEKETGLVYADSPTQSITYDFVTELEKIKHDHPMLSLAKTKDWNEFQQYFSNLDMILMLKLDGLTCSLTYENGKLIKAETRGNGMIGESILSNMKVNHTIPQSIGYTERLVIDGEIISVKSDFDSINDNNQYSNQRNFASGSIRLLDPKECEKRKLTFMAWNVVEGFNDINSFLSKLNYLENLGFSIVPYTTGLDFDAKEYLIEFAEKQGLPIDGLVGRFDDIAYGLSLGNTAHHARSAFAFKMSDEEYETHLLDIEWSLGRTGQLTPIAVFEPVDTGDSIIERASVHNLSVLYDISGGGARVGDTLSIFKANAIIPQVMSWENDGEGDFIQLAIICPVCGEPVAETISDSGVHNLVCNNPNCQGKLINILDHFCGKNGLDIKGISKATLEKLITWGWLDNITDIFILKNYMAEWINKPGFGAKSVEKILDNINNALSTTTLQQFIAAIGIPLIGTTQSKILIKYFNTWSEFYEATQTKYDFTSIEGFGESKTYELWNYDYSLAEKIAPLFTLINSTEEKSNEMENTSLTCANLTFCITGKLQHYRNRDALVFAIEALGGKVVSGVSSKTNYLINNDSTSSSAKNVAAHKLNIPILTEAEWIEQFNAET